MIMKKILLASFLSLFIACPLHAAEVNQISADNGITGWLVEDHSLPIIAIRIAFKGAGTAYDPADRQGLAKMAASLLDEGAGKCG